MHVARAPRPHFFERNEGEAPSPLTNGENEPTAGHCQRKTWSGARGVGAPPAFSQKERGLATYKWLKRTHGRSRVRFFARAVRVSDGDADHIGDGALARVARLVQDAQLAGLGIAQDQRRASAAVE